MVEQRPTKKRLLASYVRPGARVHPQSAYYGTDAHNRAQTAKPETQVLSNFLVLSRRRRIRKNITHCKAAEVFDDHDAGEDYFVSYLLEDFVIYRFPTIKSVFQEAEEGEQSMVKLRDRGAKGQGEYELPSAVYVEPGVNNLGRIASCTMLTRSL